MLAFVYEQQNLQSCLKYATEPFFLPKLCRNMMYELRRILEWYHLQGTNRLYYTVFLITYLIFVIALTLLMNIHITSTSAGHLEQFLGCQGLFTNKWRLHERRFAHIHYFEALRDGKYMCLL